VELPPFVECLHSHPLIAAVGPDVTDLAFVASENRRRGRNNDHEAPDSS
jgi:hypothetical protein